jgi:hypothetical protein
VWIVLADTSAHVFYSVQERPGEAPRFLVNDVPLDGGLDELGIEQLAQVVYPSALALWAGSVESSRSDVEHELQHRPGDTNAASPPLFLQPPPTEHAAHARRTSAIGAEYGATLVGAGLAQTLGAHASLIHENATTAIGARLHVTALLPRQETASGVELDLVGASAALGATAAYRIAERTWLPAELGASLELVHYRAGMLADPMLVATGGGLDAQPIVYARCGVRVEVGAAILGLEAILDVHLARTHYDIATGGNQYAVMVPWLVQPGLAAQVAW